MPARQIIVTVTFIVAILAGASEAHAAEACNPNGTDPARFCVTDSLTATPATTAAVPQLTLTVQNTSPTLAPDSWIGSAAFSLTSASAAAQPVLTRSSNLANGLVLTPPGACTQAMSYADCGGGHGELAGQITIGGPPQATTGSFGISKIVNVNPPGAGIYARYDMTVKGCVFVFAACTDVPDSVQQLLIPEPPAGSPARLVFTMATRVTSATVDYSMTNFSVALKGSSSQLDGGGTLSQPQTALALPAACGAIAGSTTFTSGNGRQVAVPHSITVTGCQPPADPVTPPADPDPDPDSDPPTSPDLPAQRTASTIAVSATAKGKRISADGQVDPAPSGGAVQLELLRKRGHKFVSVKSGSATLAASGDFELGFKNPKHARKCELIATFAGDSALLPSEATRKFRC